MLWSVLVPELPAVTNASHLTLWSRHYHRRQYLMPDTSLTPPCTCQIPLLSHTCASNETKPLAFHLYTKPSDETFKRSTPEHASTCIRSKAKDQSHSNTNKSSTGHAFTRRSSKCRPQRHGWTSSRCYTRYIPRPRLTFDIRSRVKATQ